MYNRVLPAPIEQNNGITKYENNSKTAMFSSLRKTELFFAEISLIFKLIKIIGKSTKPSEDQNL